MEQLTFWSEEPLAKVSPSPDLERDWQTLVATSCSASALLLNALPRSGLFGKTSPECCHLTEDGILVPSSGCWRNSGMGSPTGFWTLNTSEFNHILGPSLRDDGVCSLSDILETGDLPPRFYLSGQACKGILRRAEKRGKELPIRLRLALEQVAGGLSAPERREDRMQ